MTDPQQTARAFPDRPVVLFDGYVEIRYDGSLKTVQIYKDGSLPPPMQIYAYVDDSIADDTQGPEDFKEQYGLKLYSTVEDFKRGTSIDIFKVWQ